MKAEWECKTPEHTTSIKKGKKKFLAECSCGYSAIFVKELWAENMLNRHLMNAEEIELE